MNESTSDRPDPRFTAGLRAELVSQVADRTSVV